MDALARRRIGEFVLDQPLSTSAATIVYRAYQPTLNRYVALKVISMQEETLVAGTAVFERRFTQEAEVLTSLEHPHIVPIYHYGIVEAECAYIAMRLMHGSLKDLLNQSPLPAEHVVDIIRQLLDGLSYAHKQGVIHHAIKPGNILFDEAGSACLADFGLSNVMVHSLDVHQTDIMGSAPYTAPELIRNASTDHRSDIYSLGAIMYQLLTGKLPFSVENTSIASLLHKIEHDEPIPPRVINSAIPVEIERVVLQALQKEPRKRFFDAAEMVDALQAFSDSNVSVELSSSQRMGISAGFARPARQSNTPLVFSVIVLATLIGLLVLLTNVARENTAPHIPTVIAQSSGSIDVAEPTAAEIVRAQAILENGFIAYIACSLDSQFQATRAREMSDLAESYGLAYRVYDSSNDAYTQLTIIERARLEGSHAIILCPLKPSLLADSLRSLESAGIPLVLTNTLEEGYGGVMLSLNEYQAGRLAGEYVGKTLDENNGIARIILLTAPDYPFSEERTQGFLDGINSEQASIEILATYPTGTDRTTSESEIAALLPNIQQDVDAIFSVTDSGAYGASAALEAAGIMPGEVIIASVNAESLALDEISSGGYLRASVDIARNSGSQGALDAVVKLLGGGTLPENLTLPAPSVITYDIIAEQAPSE